MLDRISNLQPECDHQYHYSHAKNAVEDEAFRYGVMRAEIIVAQERGVEVARHGEASVGIEQRIGNTQADDVRSMCTSDAVGLNNGYSKQVTRAKCRSMESMKDFKSGEGRMGRVVKGVEETNLWRKTRMRDAECGKEKKGKVLFGGIYLSEEAALAL